MSHPITNRYEFLYLFECENGNPNGDPERQRSADRPGGHARLGFRRGNQTPHPQLRADRAGEQGPECHLRGTFHESQSPYHGRARADRRSPDPQKGRIEDKVHAGGKYMCDNFFDVRAFGAVMSTGPNAGQVRGPVQVAFSRSLDPVLSLDISITRMAVAEEIGKGKSSAEYVAWEAEQPEDKLRTMGRKSLIPYGLYAGKGFISAHLAQQTGFGYDDLKLLFEAVLNMFEHDRSASKGVMTVREIYVFKHVGTDTNAERRKAQAMLRIAGASIV